MMDKTDWKKEFYECNIQGTSISEFFCNFSTYKDFEKVEWSNGDYEKFNKAYSIVLTQIEKVQYDLGQLNILKKKFEDVLKQRYEVIS